MSEQLWTVEAVNKTEGRLPVGALLILASSSLVASVKAARWLKKNKYVGYKVVSTHYEGSIDVF